LSFYGLTTLNLLLQTLALMDAIAARLWPLFLNATCSGALWADLTMTQQNRLMEQTPAEGRSAYFAAFSVMTGLPYMAASLGIGALMAVVGVAPITLAGYTFPPT